METQISDLCARLERLAKENRWMKRVGMITVVFTYPGTGSDVFGEVKHMGITPDTGFLNFLWHCRGTDGEQR